VIDATFPIPVRLRVKRGGSDTGYPAEADELFKSRAMDWRRLSEMIRGERLENSSRARCKISSISASVIDSHISQCTR